MNISKVINSISKALLTFLICLTFSQAYSQKLLWQRQYGDSHFVHISTVLTQPDNSIIIAGHFKDRLQLGDYQMSAASNNPSHIACFLAKITPDSVVRWATKVLDGAVVKDMARDGKGDFYIAGLMLNKYIKIGDDTLKSYAPLSSFLYKCSPAQNPLWAKTCANLPDSASPLKITFDQNEMIFVWGNYNLYNDIKQLNTGRWSRGVFASFYRKDSGKIFYSRTSYDSNYKLYKVIFGNKFHYAFVGVKIKGQYYNGHPAEKLMIQRIDLGSNPLDSIVFERSAGFTFSDACADNNGNFYLSGVLTDTLAVNGNYFAPKPGGPRNMIACFTTGLSLRWLNMDSSTATKAATTLTFNKKKNKIAMVVPHNGNFSMTGKGYTSNDNGYLCAEADSASGKINYIKPLLLAKKISPQDYTGTLSYDTGGNFFYLMNYASVDNTTNYFSTVKGALANNLKDKNNNPVPSFLACWFTYDTLPHKTYNGINPVGNISSNVSFYPNPAHDKLTINYSNMPEDGIVSIKDLQGRTISSQTISAGQGNIELNVEALASGMYLINIYTESSQYISRFIKN